MEKITYEKKDKIATIKFNRPEKLNACDREAYENIISAFQLARNDEEVRAIIWEGKGRAWCAGTDMQWMIENAKSTQELQDFGLGFDRCGVNIENEANRAVLYCRKPIIAAIQGYCLGGGLSLSLLADIRIAAEGTKFGLPEVAYGAGSIQATCKILPRLIGLGKAKKLVLTAELIDAREAELIGLIDKVVALEQLHRVAIDIARKIAKNPPFAINSLKYALDHAEDWDYESILAYDEHCMTLSSPDVKKGFGAKVAHLKNGKD